MLSIFDAFYQSLPVQSVASDEFLHLLNPDEVIYARRSRRKIMLAAAALSVLGFLAYYLPVYWLPHYFPSIHVTIPRFGFTFNFPWAELLWAVSLTTIEMFLLVLLNIAGVHEIAVATGYISQKTKSERGDSLLQIGLEKKSQEARRYGIDPYQGLNKWMLFLFNLILRLKGFLGNQVIRYLTRLLLGRYAVRSILDFSGMPLYMLINAYSVHVVMCEARVIIMGQTVVGLLVEQLKRRNLSEPEKDLLYDTLQYIAVSKRDFHENHYLLTKEVLERYSTSSREEHHLSDDYLERLQQAPASLRALCQLIILLGFILDGNLSWRERIKLANLNQAGALSETFPQVKGYLRHFLDGKGVDEWSRPYLSIINK